MKGGVEDDLTGFQFSWLSDWDWRRESCVFEVSNVAVTLGFAFGAVAWKLCFCDKFQQQSSLWWMGAC